MKFGLAFVVSMILALGILVGCGVNTAVREKIITTGVYDDKPEKIKEALLKLNPGMTKEEVNSAGFKFSNKNVQCYRGSQAMQYVVGDVKPTVDL